MAIRLFLSAALACALVASCNKRSSEPEPEQEPEPRKTRRPADATPGEPAPPPPPTGATLSGLETPWGESVPADHEHPEDVPITVFDIGGQIYDLSVRDVPAVNAAGDIAYASSTSVGDLDYSNLALVIAGPDGAKKREVVIFDARADAADGDEPLELAAVRARARRANALLADESWRPMIALESTGALSGGAEQKLASADRAYAATFDEPALTIRSRQKTWVIDAGAWSKKSCPTDESAHGNVLLSGVWFDPETGSVVARVGYEGTHDCSADPIFATARAR